MSTDIPTVYLGSPDYYRKQQYLLSIYGAKRNLFKSSADSITPTISLAKNVDDLILKKGLKHCIIDVIRSETKANDLTDFLGEQWELPKKPGDDYFCFVSRIKISDSPCHLKTIIKLWKVRSTFKFNPAENYIEKVMKLMYKKTENK